ncbi:hypothetical protein Tco_1496193 [Tanacetum coccineum]
MDEDELVSIILSRPFLATARAVIDVHEGKLSLRVRNETVTFNIRKSMKYSRDDYLYCADHTVKLIWEQWVDTINHDQKWVEGEEEEEDDQLPEVISLFLSSTRKAKLLEVLRNHKGPIAWSIANIKGIDSSFCTHDEVLSPCMTFGGNTRDLGSFGEETDEITYLHRIFEEVLLTERRDGVAGIKRRHRDPSSDDVRDLVTALGRSRLNEDLESSTYQRHQDYNATPSQRYLYIY